MSILNSADASCQVDISKPDRLSLLDWLRPHCEADHACVMYPKAKGQIGPGWLLGADDVARAIAAYRRGTLADEEFASVTQDGKPYHITGGTRLGLVPHREGLVARICFDFDDHNSDGGNVHLAAAVDRFLGAEAIKFTSKGGKGLHCFYALAEPIAVELFVEWAKAWGFNRRGDIECFPKTAKRSQVWLPNEPNEKGGDAYQGGTFETCVIARLPAAPSRRLSKEVLDFLRGFVAAGYRNDALNKAAYVCGRSRMYETEARELCLRGAALCGLLTEEPDQTHKTFERGFRDGDAAKPEALRAEIEALAQAVEPWQPIEAENLDYQPFPLDALPEPIRGFVAAGSRAIGCDPSYLALPLLTALAAAIGNTRRLELKRGWAAPAIIWGAIVGESGTAKTPAFRLVMQPLRKRQARAMERHAEDMRKYRSDYLAWEKDLAVWKRGKSGNLPPAEPEEPKAERFIVSDVTIEALAPILLENPRGLLLARDELAGWIGSFDRYAGKGKTGADSANWLSMFNAENIIVDRKTGIPRTIHVPQAAMCVCGGIQPAILQRALDVEHRESGLAARLLLAYPPRKAKRWTEADIDPNAEAELVKLFDQLYELQTTTGGDGEPQPVIVQLDTEAKAAWIAYYNAHADEQAELSGDMAAAMSKLEEYPARLALIIHYVRWAAGDPTLASDDVVDASSLAAGITLANWFKHEARRVYAMLDESEGERDQRRLVEWIGRKGGTVTPREVRRGCRWLKDHGAAEAALDELVKAGWGRWQDVPATAKGGRPTRVFFVSTMSTSTKPRISQGMGGFVDVDSVDTTHAAWPQGGRPGRSFVPSTVSTVDGNAVFPEESTNNVDVDRVDVPKTVDVGDGPSWDKDEADALIAKVLAAHRAADWENTSPALMGDMADIDKAYLGKDLRGLRAAVNAALASIGHNR